MARDKIIPVRVTEEEHALWVLEAGKEKVSLGEWIRRRCSLTAGDQRDVRETVASEEGSRAASPRTTGTPQPASSQVVPSPAVSKRSYQPDFGPKLKGT